MFYDRNQLEEDLKRINSRYGVHRQEGFFNRIRSQHGDLIIGDQPANEIGEGVIYDLKRLDLDKLEMSHPAAQQILALAVETDEYYRFSPLFGAF